MAHCREVALEFVDHPPRRMTFYERVPAPPADVFDAVTADPATWRWFPASSGGGYDGPGPHGVGSKRHIRVGGVRYDETILVWDAPHRWVYRIDQSSLPMARALIEAWDFEPAGDGTRVGWTFAIDPSPMFAVMLPLAPRIMGALFRRAMANLTRSLAQT